MIRLILFDYGGVIAPEGFQLGILKLAQEFNRPFEEMYRIAGSEAGLNTGFTAGRVGEKVYWRHIGEKLGVGRDLSEYRYFYLDNFQPRQDMLELIKQLKGHYKLGIFSDQTNWIHELDQKYDFFKYFDYRFISYDVHFTKHDREFYDIPSRETKLNPDNILVVDDKPVVVERCREAGLKGYRFTTVDACREYLMGLRNRLQKPEYE